MGGQGKTTLVANVYRNNAVKSHFNCQVWVTVSQTYSVEELLRTMIREILKQKGESITTMQRLELFEIIRESLQGKRYIIVLDDVWRVDLWNDISRAFVDSKNGSRHVVTSRKHDVARIAKEEHMIELQQLNENDAWILFCKKAFRRENNNVCPQELKVYSQRILKKCQGSPLAITVIGSLLSTKEKSEIESGGSTVVGCLPTLEGSWQWKNLQTLLGVRPNEELVHRLGDMKELRTLGVFGAWKEAYCSQLCTSLSKMRNLHILRLSMDTSEEHLNFEMLNSPPPPLQKLALMVRLFEGKMPTFICSCAELLHVRLTWSHLIEDPLPSLGQLHKLVELELKDDSYEGQKLHFRTGWFLNLKRLYLVGLKNLNNIVIEEGAMANLYELSIWEVPELKMVPSGIEFLTQLQKLTLTRMPEELVGKLREDEHNEERRRIRHIPIVTIR